MIFSTSHPHRDQLNLSEGSVILIHDYSGTREIISRSINLKIFLSIEYFSLSLSCLFSILFVNHHRNENSIELSLRIASENLCWNPLDIMLIEGVGSYPTLSWFLNLYQFNFQSQTIFFRVSLNFQQIILTNNFSSSFIFTKISSIDPKIDLVERRNDW